VGRIACDEIWSFCYAKATNVPVEYENKWSRADVWTWISLDGETKRRRGSSGRTTTTPRARFSLTFAPGCAPVGFN
jgi:hypothetical protein